MNVSEAPLITVIIPVRNDFARLEECLAALELQSYPKNRIEILVINNSSEPVPERLPSEYPDVAIRKEPTPGSYAARNHGIRYARGNILAFTDADCVPDEKWIEKGVRRLCSSNSCGLVGGRIILLYKSGKPRTAVEHYESVTAFRQKENVEKSKFSVTANLFAYRRVFEETGPFREDLKSRGDAEWTRRAQSRGFRLEYAPDAIVMHPARSTFSELIQKHERVAGGLFDIRSEQEHTTLRRARDIALLLRPRVRFAFRLLKSSNENLRLLDKTLILFVQSLVQAVMLKEYVRRIFGGTACR